MRQYGVGNSSVLLEFRLVTGTITSTLVLEGRRSPREDNLFSLPLEGHGHVGMNRVIQYDPRKTE